MGNVAQPRAMRSSSLVARYYNANRLSVWRAASGPAAKRAPVDQRAHAGEHSAKQKQATIAKRSDQIAAAEGHRSEADSGSNLGQAGDSGALRRRHQL